MFARLMIKLVGCPLCRLSLSLPLHPSCHIQQAAPRSVAPADPPAESPFFLSAAADQLKAAARRVCLEGGSACSRALEALIYNRCSCWHFCGSKSLWMSACVTVLSVVMWRSLSQSVCVFLTVGSLKPRSLCANLLYWWCCSIVDLFNPLKSCQSKAGSRSSPRCRVMEKTIYWLSCGKRWKRWRLWESIWLVPCCNLMLNLLDTQSPHVCCFYSPGLWK